MKQLVRRQFLSFYDGVCNVDGINVLETAALCTLHSAVLRDLGSETAVLVTKAAVYEYRSRFVSNIVLLQN
jgi:hypothetical protein